MDPDKKIRLKKNIDKISENLDVQLLRPKLVARGIFTPPELCRITNRGAKNDQAYELVCCILQKTNAEYTSFLSCIEHDYSWLVADIHITEVTSEEINKEREHLGTLPSLIATYTGRAKEQDNVTQALCRNPHIAAIIGSPGDGKTTIALAVGHNFLDRNYRVAFIDLRGQPYTGGIITSILYKLDIPQEPSEECADKILILCQILKKQVVPILIIFDNSEDALQPNLLSQFINLLEKLSEVSNVRCLITSREKIFHLTLNIHNELLQPLSRECSIQLLQSLVSGISSEDAAKLAKASGGSPLALQLVGMMIKTGLDVDTVLTDLSENLLDDSSTIFHTLPPKQIIRKCIATSYNRLQKAGQEMYKMFRWLAIFPSGFDLKAACAIGANLCGNPQHALTGLVNRSLVLHDENMKQYKLHLLLKCYAMEKLQDEGEEEGITRLYIDYYVKRILELATEFYSERSKSALKSLEVDRSNVEHTLQLLTKHPELHDQIQLLSPQYVHDFLKEILDKDTVVPFYESAGNNKHIETAHKASFLCTVALYAKHFKSHEAAQQKFREIGQMLQKAICDSPKNGEDISFLYYQVQLARIEIVMGHTEQTVRLVQETTTENIHEDQSLESKFLHLRYHMCSCVVHHYLGNTVKSYEQITKANSVIEKHLLLQNHPINIKVNIIMAVRLTALEQIDDAEKALEKGRKMCQESDREKTPFMVKILQCQGDCLILKGKFVEAELRCKEGLELLDEVGLSNTFYHGDTLHTLGKALQKSEKYSEADRIFGQAVDLFQRKKMPTKAALNMSHKAEALKAQNKLSEAAKLHTESLKVYEEVNDLKGIQRQQEHIVKINDQMNGASGGSELGFTMYVDLKRAKKQENSDQTQQPLQMNQGNLNICKRQKLD